MTLKKEQEDSISSPLSSVCISGNKTRNGLHKWARGYSDAKAPMLKDVGLCIQTLIKQRSLNYTCYLGGEWTEMIIIGSKTAGVFLCDVGAEQRLHSPLSGANQQKSSGCGLSCLPVDVTKCESLPLTSSELLYHLKFEKIIFRLQHKAFI